MSVLFSFLHNLDDNLPIVPCKNHKIVYWPLFAEDVLSYSKLLREGNKKEMRANYRLNCSIKNKQMTRNLSSGLWM